MKLKFNKQAFQTAWDNVQRRLKEAFPDPGSVVTTAPQPSLQQKLKLFDPSIHGGELHVDGALGAERF